MSISEPTTMVTDYALAFLCLYFAVFLGRHVGGRVGLWVWAFIVTAIAAILGGTAHGFRAPLGERWHVVWELTVWSIAAGSGLLIAAGVRAAMRSEASGSERREGIRWLKGGLAITLVGLAVLVGRVSFHEHFNQNDLYHVIQMGGLYCLFRAARRLHGITEFDTPRENGR